MTAGTIGRRGAIGTLVGGAVAAATLADAAGAAGAPPARPIVLYCDLKVDPAREKEMLDHFHKRFKPAGARFKGFIDLKMLKLRAVIQGDPLPAAVNYRFQLTYESEELRQAWIKSSVHAELWPGIENTLIDKNFHVSLFDQV